MPRDNDKSLGDEATLQGGKVQPADERSLGDRSTFGGGDGSSLSDLGEFADLPTHYLAWSSCRKTAQPAKRGKLAVAKGAPLGSRALLSEIARLISEPQSFHHFRAPEMSLAVAAD